MFTTFCSRIVVPVHGNKRAKDKTDSSFWNEVPDGLIVRAYKKYFWDFEMLGHSPVEYLESQGMPRKAEKLGPKFERIRRKLLGMD